MTSTQSALVGNGRLLVSLDGRAGMLGASWPHVDSFNQLRELKLALPSGASDAAAEQQFVSDTVVETKFDGVRIFDEVLQDRDVWVRTIDGAQDHLLVCVSPQLDGRVDDQTIYFDERHQVLLAYHRSTWVAIGGDAAVLEWQCSAGDVPDAVDSGMPLTGERIASRVVHGFLRLPAGNHPMRVLIGFAATREAALENIQAARSRPVETPGRADTTDDVLAAQSRNVIRLLTSATTGGVLAGPPLQVDIASEPGYAAVWGRDAAWIEFGSLAAGDSDRVKRFLEFAFRVQSPEGLWLHRHHTDYSVGSSWGLHQLDETGIILHLLACYASKTGDWTFAADHWDGVRRAGEFLANSIGADGLPLPSVDLWEERESQSAYTAASFVGGLRAAALVAEQTVLGPAEAERWRVLADQLAEHVLETFWSPSEGRFIKSVLSRAALQLDDPTRTDLPSKLLEADSGPNTTPLPEYPNWTTGETSQADLTFDISVLGLAVPFNVIPADDPRIVETIDRLRSHLWTDGVGGYRRYEGDTYGGGNPWPVATLWVACWEAARGNIVAATALLDWVREHTGPNDMIAEQVHRSTGAPVAALPMAWSHGMVLLTLEAISGSRVWEINAPHLATTAG